MLPEIRPLRLFPAALDAMEALRKRIDDIEKTAGSLSSGLAGFAGKLAGLAGSIALILHMAADPDGGAEKDVSRETVKSVERIVFEFNLPHALEFYQKAQGNSGGETLRNIASWILTNYDAAKPRITLRDFVRGPGALRGKDAFEVNKAVAPLVAVDWLRPDGSGPIAKSWAIPRHVFEQMAARKEVETKRRDELGRLMNAPWAKPKDPSGGAP